MSISTTLPLLFILLPCFIFHASGHGACREPLRITNGVSGGRVGPHPYSKLWPLNFTDRRLAIVYPVIQKFKCTITSDPLGITKTWVGPNICNYTGFYCDNPPDNNSAIALASVDFNGFHLAAPTLDGFLDQLPDLAVFHANSNNFTGILSPNIAKLPYFFELDISNNQFSGQFPTAVVGVNGLEFLDLRFNSFKGSVPAQIFAQNLYALFINNNDFIIQLSGTISMTKIRYLTFANNQFNGTLPENIFKALSSLTEVLFLNDGLKGCLPYEVGFLKEAVVVDFGNNQLTGPLPLSLACLDKVEELNFAGNLLYGIVPEVVCGLKNLANLSLSNNYFTFVGPVCWFQIKKGVLDVRNNCIPHLPFQRPIHECVEFFLHPRFCPKTWHDYIPCKPLHFVPSITEMAGSP
ncbi:hypothetical protein SLEP1_g16721 [Rubroshorea leprosula]|uniref:Uncharacterized protein n=1 Tax=Rubroshorea leprosula TaxID=152421 RepID=A0AAV5J0U7_9ROSI|nr:hypothetical protein SLEP1_g16721 [Rubroshorea leprosula]